MTLNSTALVIAPRRWGWHNVLLRRCGQIRHMAAQKLQRNLLLRYHEWAELCDDPYAVWGFRIGSGLAVLLGSTDFLVEKSSTANTALCMYFVSFAACIFYSAVRRYTYILYYAIPLFVLSLNIHFLTFNSYMFVAGDKEVDVSEVTFSALLFIKNGIFFRRRVAVYLNLSVLSAVIMYNIIYFSARQNFHDLSPRDSEILMATAVSACIVGVEHFGMAVYQKSVLRLLAAEQRIQDIENTARLRDENQRIKDEMARLNRVSVIEAMSTTIAHEVNQPIGSALTFAEAAKRWMTRHQPDHGEALRAIDGAIEQVKRTGRIVSSIRSMTARVPAEFQPVSLNQQIESLLALLRGQMHEKNIRLNYITPDEAGSQWAMARPEEINQVVLNLVGNSVEAFEDDREDKQITVSISVTRPGWGRIAVTDNGCGIEPDLQPIVFDSFATSKQGGTGLGLAICREIAENHGGSLSFESVPQQYTTFTFDLPLMPAANSAG